MLIVFNPTAGRLNVFGGSDCFISSSASSPSRLQVNSNSHSIACQRSPFEVAQDDPEPVAALLLFRRVVMGPF